MNNDVIVNFFNDNPHSSTILKKTFNSKVAILGNIESIFSEKNGNINKN